MNIEQYAHDTKHKLYVNPFERTQGKNTRTCKVVTPPVYRTICAGSDEEGQNIINPELAYKRTLFIESPTISKITLHKSHRNFDPLCICDNIEENWLDHSDEYFIIKTRQYFEPKLRVLDFFKVMDKRKMATNIDKVAQRHAKKPWNGNKLIEVMEKQKRQLLSAHSSPIAKNFDAPGLSTGCYLLDPKDVDVYLERKSIPVGPIISLDL